MFHRPNAMRCLQLAVVAVAIAAFQGCASYVAVHDPANTLDINSPVAVDIDCFAGNVIVRGDDNRTDVAVSIIREALHPKDRKTEGEASLDNIKVSTNVESTDAGPVVHITVTSTDDKPWLHRAHLLVEAPGITNARITTTGGYVEASMCEGEIDIRTDGGDVRFMTVLQMNQPITIVNSGGDIDLRMRAESTGNIDAHAISGRVAHRIRYGELIVSETGPERLRATLNGGSNPVTLRTVDGDIRIAVVPDPFDIGRYIVDP